jgi:hypothetical protein
VDWNETRSRITAVSQHLLHSFGKKLADEIVKVSGVLKLLKKLRGEHLFDKQMFFFLFHKSLS